MEKESRELMLRKIENNKRELFEIMSELLGTDVSSLADFFRLFASKKAEVIELFNNVDDVNLKRCLAHFIEEMNVFDKKVAKLNLKSMSESEVFADDESVELLEKSVFGLYVLKEPLEKMLELEEEGV